MEGQRGLPYRCFFVCFFTLLVSFCGIMLKKPDNPPRVACCGVPMGPQKWNEPSNESDLTDIEQLVAIVYNT